jgi:hypothetical protein
VKWGELFMLLSHYSHTPLTDIWQMTWGQFTLYADAMPEVAKLTSPFGGGDGKKEEAMSDEASIKAYGRLMGFYRGPNA